ncbi:MAG TPA: GtrA family protein [Candidatus Acidoferrales bacterium]|nr:GtrA family protein [Candidatus Acidoferrales bacterium]
MKDKLATLANRLPLRSLTRWWIVGMAFLLVGTGILYVARDILRLPVILATPVAAELTLLVRFLANDSWVFGQGNPTWRRLWQFHVASAGGFVIWMAVTNGLYQLGVQYLIASVIGSACSMCFSIVTNFLWVWRGKAGGISSAESSDVPMNLAQVTKEAPGVE